MNKVVIERAILYRRDTFFFNGDYYIKYDCRTWLLSVGDYKRLTRVARSLACKIEIENGVLKIVR